MYKATVRAMIRRSVRRLNQGDYGPALAVYADDATLTFPGDNSWARQFRPPRPDREQHPTHQGRDEIEAFLKRYVEQGIQMEVEDILVNGPPWNMRAAVRVHDWVNKNGVDVYNNRAVLFVTMRWGRITTQEDYEDTERTAAFDRYSATTTASATSAV
jgi:ketosteroid isomerase-like protein